MRRMEVLQRTRSGTLVKTIMLKFWSVAILSRRIEAKDDDGGI